MLLRLQESPKIHLQLLVRYLNPTSRALSNAHMEPVHMDYMELQSKFLFWLLDLQQVLQQPILKEFV